MDKVEGWSQHETRGQLDGGADWMGTERKQESGGAPTFGRRLRNAVLKGQLHFVYLKNSVWEFVICNIFCPKSQAFSIMRFLSGSGFSWNLN